MKEREPGWLTVYRCTKNERHLLYLEGALAGFPEDSDVPGHQEDLWCLWGDGGHLDRLPGPMLVVDPMIEGVAGPLGLGNVPTAPIPDGA